MNSQPSAILTESLLPLNYGTSLTECNWLDNKAGGIVFYMHISWFIVELACGERDIVVTISVGCRCIMRALCVSGLCVRVL